MCVNFVAFMPAPLRSWLLSATKFGNFGPSHGAQLLQPEVWHCQMDGYQPITSTYAWNHSNFMTLLGQLLDMYRKLDVARLN